MTPPPPEESMVAGDPTQRLLTALGRFQRQVARAEEGAPQEAWCDECMNQLIIGIEIALNEDWGDVKEALTDAARILQTYEDSGCAEQCVRFLKDSYEILCLMVGDLIVGNARSGVMKKWQERYERALDELADAGLTLVDDDGPVERETPAPASSSRADEAGEDFDNLLEGDTPSGSIFDDSPIGLGEGRAFRADPDDPFAPVADDQDGDDLSPFEAQAAPMANGSGPASVPSLDELLGRPLTPEDDLEDDEGEAPAPELSDDFTAETDFEREERMADFDSAPDDPNAGDDALAAEADERDEPAAHAPEPSEAGELDFGDATGDMDAGEEDSEALHATPDLSHEAAETETMLIDEVVEAQYARAAAPEAPAPEPAPGTPEALLKTAQMAMAAGNVADAKFFALQLAANMAKLEADQVQARIAQIEKEIESTSEAVTAGELAVNEAEERVRKLEEEAGRCQHEFEEKQRHTGTLRDEVAAVEGSVADLNRQIDELIARRDAEVERLEGCQAGLEDSISEESRMQAELDSLREEEAGSRENLDGARGQVHALQEAATAHAAALESTQEELARRRRAVEDIENTIRHIGGVIAGGEHESGDGAPESHSE